MNCRSMLILLTILYSVLSPGMVHPGKTKWDMSGLKSILGTWKGKDDQGNAVTSTFQLIADENAVMETLNRLEAGETIVRVYYLDNGALMLTQYGTRGNQPRMRIDRQKSSETTMVFSLLDVTNTAAASGVQVRDFALEQHDRSTLAESWTVRKDGMDSVEKALLSRVTLDNAGAGLERMKTLLGNWKGKDARGNRVDVTYSFVADSTAIMESLDIRKSGENMVTVYTLNGGNTVLTHYCSMGNQPRMKLDGAASTGTVLVFKYVDATNVKSDLDPRMHDLTLTFRDMDHFSQEWILSIEGKVNSTVYEFERVKPAEQPAPW